MIDSAIRGPNVEAVDANVEVVESSDRSGFAPGGLHRGSHQGLVIHHIRLSGWMCVCRDFVNVEFL
jgi:hypothetical protein